MTERDTLLKQVTILDFNALDMQLFLNTHPDNAEAQKIHAAFSENARRARAAYEQQFGPLTATTTTVGWINEPWPWQADYNFRLSEGGQ